MIYLTINRRDFLEKSAAAIAGGAVLPSTALSYARVLGANDRISLGHIGMRKPRWRSRPDCLKAEDEPQRRDDGVFVICGW